MSAWRVTGVRVERQLLQEAVDIIRRGGDPDLQPPLPQALYKYVDRDDAKAVSEGSLKFGSAQTYEKLENGRSDSMEGRSIVRPGNINIAEGEGQAIRDGMAEIGLNVSGAITMYSKPGGMIIRTEPCPYTIGCYSLSPSSRPLLKAPKRQAIFQINSVAAYLLRLLEIVDQPVLIVGPANYEAREFKNFDEPGFKGSDPFRKPRTRRSDGHSFENEKEYRLLFELNSGVSLDPYDPDEQLSRLLHRIR